MIRLPQGSKTDFFHHVMSTLPRGIRRILGNVDLVMDTDPCWIGLHFHRKTADGRSYSQTSHVNYWFNQEHLPADRRSTTVVLIGDGECRGTILHELGHVLDERLDFDSPEMKPLDWYAATNRREAFATAFQAWTTVAEDVSSVYHRRSELLELDPAASAFFDRLAA